MICLGNICRSPLAEGIMKNKIAQHDLDWTVDSAGTGSWHVGERPDQRSAAVAQKYGIDINNQRARQLRADDLREFDLIFAMDSSNYQNIISMANSPAEEGKIHLIMNVVKPDYNQNVPDPYFDNDGFEQVFQMLDEACEHIIEKFTK